MSFVLDNSISMRWFFGDGAPHDREYAGIVLDAMEKMSAIVPVTWGLEVANVIAPTEVKEIMPKERSSAFLEMLKVWISR